MSVPVPRGGQDVPPPTTPPRTPNPPVPDRKPSKTDDCDEYGRGYVDGYRACTRTQGGDSGACCNQKFLFGFALGLFLALLLGLFIGLFAALAIRG